MSEIETGTEQPINLDSFFAQAFAETETDLRERINRMISAGAFFEVAIDDFQIFGADNLSMADRKFLTVNKKEILCTLQQGLLVNHLFSEKPELRQSFISEIEERGASFEAISEITVKWFNRLLETNLDRNENN